jgi:tellurite resistance protein TerC
MKAMATDSAQRYDSAIAMRRDIEAFIGGHRVSVAPGPPGSLVLRVMRRVMPVTKDFHEQRFLVNIGGVRHATPLLVALLVVEFTDILFALDSVPAIFAVTREPLIVFTSNIFAILGLRALYFLLAGAMDTFHLLHYGLGVVLMFVGVKLVLPIFGMHVPIGISLSVICGVIGASIALSLLFPKKPHAA